MRWDLLTTQQKRVLSVVAAKSGHFSALIIGLAHFKTTDDVYGVVNSLIRQGFISETDSTDDNPKLAVTEKGVNLMGSDHKKEAIGLQSMRPDHKREADEIVKAVIDGAYSRPLICKATGISDGNVKRRLKPLIVNGILEKDGRWFCAPGKQGVYGPKERAKPMSDVSPREVIERRLRIARAIQSGFTTTKKISLELDIPKPTVNGLISPMIMSGLIERYGRGRIQLRLSDYGRGFIAQDGEPFTAIPKISEESTMMSEIKGRDLTFGCKELTAGWQVSSQPERTSPPCKPSIAYVGDAARQDPPVEPPGSGTRVLVVPSSRPMGEPPKPSEPQVELPELEVEMTVGCQGGAGEIVRQDPVLKMLELDLVKLKLEHSDLLHVLHQTQARLVLVEAQILAIENRSESVDAGLTV